VALVDTPSLRALYNQARARVKAIRRIVGIARVVAAPCVRFLPALPSARTYTAIMATFVHLTSAKLASHIHRGGIRPVERYGKRSPGIFAMPVAPSYLISHQWARELRKWRSGRIVGVYFRLPDDEQVLVGRYNREHERMTAAEAVAAIMRLEHEALGYEVIIPRDISPGAILRMRSISSRIGWRHFPGAHGRRPCGCPACVGRGVYNSQRLRRDFQQRLGE
jgi:hypothetical protein